jgi:hypothetical protein
MLSMLCCAVQAWLGILPTPFPQPLHAIAGYVLNVNVPDHSSAKATAINGRSSGSGGGTAGPAEPPSIAASGLEPLPGGSIRGFYLAWQGMKCTFLKFVELEADPGAWGGELPQAPAHGCRQAARPLEERRLAAEPNGK